MIQTTLRLLMCFWVRHLNHILPWIGLKNPNILRNTNPIKKWVSIYNNTANLPSIGIIYKMISALNKNVSFFEFFQCPRIRSLLLIQISKFFSIPFFKHILVPLPFYQQRSSHPIFQYSIHFICMRFPL